MTESDLSHEVGGDSRFARIFQSNLTHGLLDRETEVALAQQAQAEISSWDAQFSSLPHFASEEERVAFLQDLRARSRNIAPALNRLLSSNYRLMLKMAFRFRVWGEKRGYNVSALFSLAFEGYLHAIRKFDCGRNIRLSTYSVHWMQQYIRRELHERGRLIRPPYNAEITALYVSRSETVLRTLHGREPTDDELVTELINQDRRKKQREAKRIKRELRKQGRYAEVVKVVPEAPISVDEAKHHLHIYRASVPDPISMESLRLPNGEVLELPDHRSQGQEPVDTIMTAQTARYVQEAVELLSPVEQKVIRLRFLNESPTTENLTLQEAGDSPELGLSRERIRQIQGVALTKLRKHLEHVRVS